MATFKPRERLRQTTIERISKASNFSDDDKCRGCTAPGDKRWHAEKLLFVLSSQKICQCADVKDPSVLFFSPPFRFRVHPLGSPLHALLLDSVLFAV